MGRKRFLLILSITVLVIALGLSLLVVFSAPLLHWFIEYQGSRTAGRSLQIDGLDLDWHWRGVQLDIGGLQVVNPPGYREARMVTVEHAQLHITLTRLWSDEPVITYVRLDKPVLNLERKSKDERNWAFSSDASVSQDGNALASIPRIERLEIIGGRVLFHDALRHLSLRLDLDSFRGTDTQREGAASPYSYTLNGSGELQARPFELKLAIAGLEALTPSAGFPVRLDMTMDKTRVKVEGVFKDLPRFTAMDASLRVEGDNLADLFYLTAIPLPPTPPYRLQGQLTKTGDRWGYQNFAGQVGASDLSGNLSYDLGGARGLLTAELFSSRLESADLGGFIGLPPPLDSTAATDEQRRAAAEKAAGAKLIPDVPLNTKRLVATDLDVKFDARKIVAPDLPFKGMRARLRVRDGHLVLQPLKVVLADGSVEGSISVDARQESPPMRAQLQFHGLSLARFFENSRFAETTGGRFGGQLDLRGSGLSLAEALGSSNGKIQFIMSGGRISLLLIEAADIDIGEALPLFLGDDKSTRIRCGLADFSVSAGVLASTRFLLDTEDSLLTGDVGIDLQEETIAARLDAKPKDASIFSARIPITLNGKLKQPELGLDREKISSRGGAALALGTLLAPAAALLAFVDSGDAKDVDCRELIATDAP